MDINYTANQINVVHKELQSRAKAAINISLSVCNRVIGYYLVEYEQKGKDRAVYGKKTLNTLSEKLKEKGLTSVSDRELRNYRTFYNTYPFFIELFIQSDKNQIRGALSHELQSDVNEQRILNIPAYKLITHLSYSHFSELIKVKENLKRTFYELETISGIWSTRELKKQIASLYFERSGLSTNNVKLQELANINTETNETTKRRRNSKICRTKNNL